MLNLFKLKLLAQLLLLTKCSAIAELLDALTTITDYFPYYLFYKTFKYFLERSLLFFCEIA